eukprot:8849641-Pyramimonas_sp.AAC.1
MRVRRLGSWPRHRIGNPSRAAISILDSSAHHFVTTLHAPRRGASSGKDLWSGVRVTSDDLDAGVA